jgi:hypothetical protein
MKGPDVAKDVGSKRVRRPLLEQVDWAERLSLWSLKADKSKVAAALTCPVGVGMWGLVRRTFPTSRYEISRKRAKDAPVSHARLDTKFAHEFAASLATLRTSKMRRECGTCACQARDVIYYASSGWALRRQSGTTTLKLDASRAPN